MYNAQTHSDGIWSHIARRILIAVVTLFLVSLMIFFFIQLAPRDEVYPYPSTFQEQNLIETFPGLDQPLVVQYFRWMGGIFTGDWGQSIMGDSHYKY